MQTLMGESLNLTEYNLHQLKEIFPEVFCEDKIDFDKLRLILGDNVEDKEERYEFTWNGKSNAIRIAQTPSTGTLRPDRESSKNWDDTENLYIEGDNLEVLKLLQKSYFGKVKMIYIDPPYNTGKDFIYKDNFRDNIANYKEITNQVTKANPETNGRYHTDWLNMMYPRLKLARNLLREDGVIFISINDKEESNLTKICNEVFGQENFVVKLIWSNKEGGGSSDSKYFRVKHEYILCYAKQIDELSILGVDINNVTRYTMSDEYIDIRGPYYLQKLGMGSIQYSPSLDYPILMPDGTYIMPIDNNNGKKACWRWSKSKFKWGLENGFVEIKKDNKGVWTVYTKQYLKCDNEGNLIERTQRPLGIIDEYSSTQASKFLDELGLGTCFNYSKPIDLINYLIKRVCKKDDLILDFFSGSATTANSVIELNKEDQGIRKYIMIQLPELTEEKREAYKLGYKNICEIGKERIRRAGDKIVLENKDKEGIENLDIGFKVFKLDSSNLKSWDSSIENLEQNLLEMDTNLKKDRTSEDLLYEILLKSGVELTAKIEEIKVGYNTLYNIGQGALLVCLDEKITQDVIDEIPKHKSSFMETKVIFKDAGFMSDSAKINAIQNLKQFKIEDVRSV